MLIDYRTMLNNRFVLNNAIISSPKSFGVACTVLSQIIAAVSSSQYGGQTINRIDEGLAKYVTKSYVKILKDYIDIFSDEEDFDGILSKLNKIDYDKENIDVINDTIFNKHNDIHNKIIEKSLKKIKKEVYDGMQCFEYQINTICGTNG